MLEVIIGLSIISVVLFSLANVAIIALRIAEENTKNIQALFLAEEGIESLRVLRDSGWNSNIGVLNTGTVYYLNFSDGKWNTSSSPSSNIYIDGVFERSFTVQEVYRNSNDRIVSSEGTLDQNTKKITVSVSWFSRNATTTKSISTYITNLFSD